MPHHGGQRHRVEHREDGQARSGPEPCVLEVEHPDVEAGVVGDDDDDVVTGQGRLEPG